MLQKVQAYSGFEVSGDDPAGSRYSQRPDEDQWIQQVVFNTSDNPDDPARVQVASYDDKGNMLTALTGVASDQDQVGYAGFWLASGTEYIYTTTGDVPAGRVSQTKAITARIAPDSPLLGWPTALTIDLNGAYELDAPTLECITNPLTAEPVLQGVHRILHCHVC